MSRMRTAFSRALRGSVARSAMATAALALVSTGCVRLELDGLDTQEGEPQALRVSQEDAVVLCPLSAAANVDGDISVVWAGYPPADDRLQLMHAKVNLAGELVQSAQPVAFLEQDLLAIKAETSDTGLRVFAIENESSEMLAIDLDAEGSVLDAQVVAADALAVSERCELHIQAGDSKVRVFRGQVDGELPLFVEVE